MPSYALKGSIMHDVKPVLPASVCIRACTQELHVTSISFQSLLYVVHKKQKKTFRELLLVEGTRGRARKRRCRGVSGYSRGTGETSIKHCPLPPTTNPSPPSTTDTNLSSGAAKHAQLTQPSVKAGKAETTYVVRLPPCHSIQGRELLHVWSLEMDFDSFKEGIKFSGLGAEGLGSQLSQCVAVLVNRWFIPRPTNSQWLTYLCWQANQFFFCCINLWNPTYVSPGRMCFPPPILCQID